MDPLENGEAKDEEEDEDEDEKYDGIAFGDNPWIPRFPSLFYMCICLRTIVF